MDIENYFDAIHHGETLRLKQLLTANPGLIDQTASPADAAIRDNGGTGLHAAVHANQPEIARILLDAGVDINARTREGRTALHDSIEFGRGDIQKLLLDHGAEVDINAAAILGKVDLVRAFLDHDPELANDFTTELSPLGWAAFGNQVPAARLLLERGARMDDGELLCAASVGHVEVGKLLLEHGANPDTIDPVAGGNALHAAASMRYTHDARKFVELLLDHGADLTIRTIHGRTAQDIAEMKAEEQEAEPTQYPKRYREVASLLARRSGAPRAT